MKKAKDRSNDFERLPWKSEAEKKRYYRSHCIGACEFTPCMCPKCRRERFEEQELKAAKEDLLEAYRRIEECREAMNSAVENIDDLTEEFPKLAELWKGFVKLGGISSHELEKHLGGKIIRARHQRTKKHLRLVSDRPIKPIMIKRRHRNDDDVA